MTPLSYDDFRRLLADEPLPAALVDLNAVDRNHDRLMGELGTANATMRIATKSLRHPYLIRYLLQRGGGRTRGLMAYAALEAAALADEGFEDLLVAYPLGSRIEAEAIARRIAGGAVIRPTVDHADQLPHLVEAARTHGVSMPVCLDVDLSWRPMGMHFGVRRSPIRSAKEATELAERIADTGVLRLDAVLAYEAQIAGMRDVNPGTRHLDPIRGFIKARSRPLARDRRGEIVEALRGSGHAVSVVNGGGTGSVSFTSADPAVTEVTAGSGFLCPHLFTGYAGSTLEPAAFFSLRVTRTSDPDHITCQGGGYVASGAAGADRLPVVHLPAGVSPLGLEGFGEVQTPFRCSGARLGVGDPIVCRHAKAGELAERFASFLLVRNGEVVDRQPTYRGRGWCFG